METFDELAHSFKLRLCNALHICDRMAAFLQYLIYLNFLVFANGIVCSCSQCPVLLHFMSPRSSFLSQACLFVPH